MKSYNKRKRMDGMMTFREMISLKTAGRFTLTGLALLTLLHMLVLLRLLPSNIVWGGQLGDEGANVYLMEGIALGVTLLIMAAVILRLRISRKEVPGKLAVISMWVVFVLFAFSTIGNLTSPNTTETVIFTPLSAVLTLLVFRMAIGD